MDKISKIDNDITIAPENGYIDFDWNRVSFNITFGDAGELTWDDKIIDFKGNATECARVFFEEFLKKHVDEYIEQELKNKKIL